MFWGKIQMPIWSFLTQSGHHSISSPITSQRQHSESHASIAQHYATQFLGCCWVNKMPIETNPFWCKFAETPGSTVQWSQRYVLIMNPPLRSPYEWNSSCACLLLTWTRLHSCRHSSAIWPKVICASINQSVPLFYLMCLKIYSSVWNIRCS